MPSESPQERRPRGPWKELYKAAEGVFIERLTAILSTGSIGIDQGDPQGYTPLTIAASRGYSCVVRILLDEGASVSFVGRDGFTALHRSAMKGHVAVTKMLIGAGADLEAKDSPGGDTPLLVAAYEGHFDVMRALIEAGANPDNRSVDGSTPLYVAAQGGHVNGIKLLLRAEANPLLIRTEAGQTAVPLDMAAQHGHLEAVRWIMQEVGIDGCGGASGGVDAMWRAASFDHVDVLAVLADAGVVDTGTSLFSAVVCSYEASVKFLLQQQELSTGGAAAYVNTVYDNSSRTPLVSAIVGTEARCYAPSSRIVRLLVDAGADAASAVQIQSKRGRNEAACTPLSVVTTMLKVKHFGGKDLTHRQVHGLEGIRRLLLRVEAVHAISWLWPGDVPSIANAVEWMDGTEKLPPPVTLMLPILGRRASRPRVLLAALFRWVMM